MNLLEIRHLRVRLGDQPVIPDLSFAVAPGEILGVIGPNGSGKSTLLRALAGILSGESGEILAQGESIAGWSAARRARFVTYVGAELSPEFPVTAGEVIRMGAICGGVGSVPRDLQKRLEQVAAQTGCTPFMDRALETLSQGERQRVAIARALFQNSKVVLLDESLAKLDLHHQAELGHLLRTICAEEQKSFVLVSHDLNYTTDWADRCLLIRAGQKIAEGPTDEAVTEDRLRALYPDARFTLAPHPTSGALKVYFRT